jgi:hypothetical protein
MCIATRKYLVVFLYLYIFIIAFMLNYASDVSAIGIAGTKHNLSTSGPGPVKATTEERICVFCHTPHHAITQVDGISVPLWNHTLSSAAYTLYTSATFLSPTSPGSQPDGPSRLCLSCHDGTVAIGSVVHNGLSSNSITVQGTGGGGEMPVGSTNLGTILSGHHPISIEVNNALINDKQTQCNDNIVSFKVCAPPGSSPVKLSRTNNTYGAGPSTGLGVQCSSCHDPHEDPTPGVTLFLRLGDRLNYDALCSACHVSCAEPCL